MADAFTGTATNANQDISVKLMDHLWSTDWYRLGVDGGVQVIPNANNYFIYQILTYMNTFILAGVVLFMVYTTFIGVTGTAHEGVPLGRRFSTIWVPIRAAVGISCLAPIFSGLSIMQILIFQLIAVSINQANLVNDALTNSFFNVGNGQVSSSLTLNQIPGLDQTSQNVAGVVFKTLVIQGYYTQVNGNNLQNNTVYTQSNQGNSTIYEFSAPDQNWISNFWSGKIMANTKVTCDDANSALCIAKNNAMFNLIGQLMPVALNYVNLKNPLTNSPSLPQIQTQYSQAVNTYQNALSAGILANIDPNGTFANQSQNFLNSTAADKGWLNLGGYYWIMTRAAQSVLAEAAKVPSAKWADMNLLEEFAISGGNLDEYIEGTTQITTSVGFQQAPLETFASDSMIRDILAWPADFTTDYFLNKMAGRNPATGAQDGNIDVIANLQEIGHQIIMVGNSAITLLFFSDTISSKLSEWVGAATGGSLTTAPEESKDYSAIGLVLIKILLVGLLVLFLLYPLAISLAYYLPAIPMIIWILAGLNWWLGTITIMIGAPIWAAAISLPDGEGLAGARGQEGFMLLLNVILRPTLMVIGFMIAYMGIRILGVYLFEIFDAGITAMNAQHTRGLVSIFVTIFMFGMVIIIAAQKLFLLIIHFPDIILSFIGKNLPGGGEGGDEQKIQSMFDRFRQKGNGGLTSITGGRR